MNGGQMFNEAIEVDEPVKVACNKIKSKIVWQKITAIASLAEMQVK